MIHLPLSLSAWGTPAFADTFKAEVARLGAARLPLQQGLSGSSHALDDKLDVMIIDTTEADGCLRIKAGLFYSGIIAGCSCADDPTQTDVTTEYCVIRIEIDKATAASTVTLLAQ